MGPSHGSSLERWTILYVVLLVLECLVLTGFVSYNVYLIVKHHIRFSLYIISFFLMYLFSIYVVLDATVTKNRYNLYSSVASHILMTIFTVWNYFFKSDSVISYNFELMVITCVMQGIYLLFIPLIVKSYSWRIFSVLGIDFEMQSIYRKSNKYYCVLKFDLLLSLLLVLQVSHYLIQNVTNIQSILCFIMIGVSLLLYVISYHIISSESFGPYTIKVILMALLIVSQIAFCLYKLTVLYLYSIPYYSAYSDHSIYLATLLVVFSFLCKGIMLFYFTASCSNFGLGLITLRKGTYSSQFVIKTQSSTQERSSYLVPSDDAENDILNSLKTRLLGSQNSNIIAGGVGEAHKYDEFVEVYKDFSSNERGDHDIECLDDHLNKIVLTMGLNSDSNSEHHGLEVNEGSYTQTYSNRRSNNYSGLSINTSPSINYSPPAPLYSLGPTITTIAASGSPQHVSPSHSSLSLSGNSQEIARVGYKSVDNAGLSNPSSYSSPSFISIKLPTPNSQALSTSSSTLIPSPMVLPVTSKTSLPHQSLLSSSLASSLVSPTVVTSALTSPSSSLTSPSIFSPMYSEQTFFSPHTVSSSVTPSSALSHSSPAFNITSLPKSSTVLSPIVYPQSLQNSFQDAFVLDNVSGAGLSVNGGSSLRVGNANEGGGGGVSPPLTSLRILSSTHSQRTPPSIPTHHSLDLNSESNLISSSLNNPKTLSSPSLLSRSLQSLSTSSISESTLPLNTKSNTQFSLGSSSSSSENPHTQLHLQLQEHKLNPNLDLHSNTGTLSNSTNLVSPISSAGHLKNYQDKKVSSRKHKNTTLKLQKRTASDQTDTVNGTLTIGAGMEGVDYSEESGVIIIGSAGTKGSKGNIGNGTEEGTSVLEAGVLGNALNAYYIQGGDDIGSIGKSYQTIAGSIPTYISNSHSSKHRKTKSKGKLALNKESKSVVGDVDFDTRSNSPSSSDHTHSSNNISISTGLSLSQVNSNSGESLPVRLDYDDDTFELDENTLCGSIIKHNSGYISQNVSTSSNSGNLIRDGFDEVNSRSIGSVPVVGFYTNVENHD